MNIISISAISRDKNVLAGSHAGKRVSEKLWEIAVTAIPGILVIDFTHIEVATSSFLREAVVKFRTLIRDEKPSIYPVISNLSLTVEEELGNLLNQMGEAIWVFEFGKDSQFKKCRLLGRIDQKLRETLDFIDQGLGHDANTLWKNTNTVESIGVTAWNNRLASLAKQGLVFESKVGKLKYFHPIQECGGVRRGS